MREMKAIRPIKALLTELMKVSENPQAAGDEGWEAEGYSQRDYFEAQITEIESTSVFGCMHFAKSEIRDELIGSLNKATDETVIEFSEWYRVPATESEEVYEIAVTCRNEYSIYSGAFRLEILR